MLFPSGDKVAAEAASASGGGLGSKLQLPSGLCIVLPLFNFCLGPNAQEFSCIWRSCWTVDSVRCPLKSEALILEPVSSQALWFQRLDTQQWPGGAVSRGQLCPMIGPSPRQTFVGIICVIVFKGTVPRKPICHHNIEDKCRFNRTCTFDHAYDLPYMWCIKLNDSWFPMEEQNAKIERAFSDPNNGKISVTPMECFVVCTNN